MNGPSSPRAVWSRRADRFVLAQAFLALLTGLLLFGSGLGRQAELAGQLLALCQRTANTLATQGWLLILLIPPLLGILSLVLGVLSIWRQLRATRRLLRGLGPARPLSPDLVVLGERIGLAGRLRLVADPRPLAFCAGWVRPSVWLTTGLLDGLDQDAVVPVLRHEMHHVRHRDPLKLLLVRALADALFFLPVVRDLVRAYQVHKELAADTEAILSPADQLGLARALIYLLPHSSAGFDGAAVGPLMFGKPNGGTGARLALLSGGGVPSFVPRRRSLLLTGLILFLFLILGLSPLTRPARAVWGGSCAPTGSTPLALWLDAP